jgi:hypothetical protein
MNKDGRPVVSQPVDCAAIVCDCGQILVKITHYIDEPVRAEHAYWDGHSEIMVGKCEKCGKGTPIRFTKIMELMASWDTALLPAGITMRRFTHQTRTLKHREVQAMFDGWEWEERHHQRGATFGIDMKAGTTERKTGENYPLVVGDGFKAFESRQVPYEAPFNGEYFYEIPMKVIRDELRHASTTKAN